MQWVKDPIGRNLESKWLTVDYMRGHITKWLFIHQIFIWTPRPEWLKQATHQAVMPYAKFKPVLGGYLMLLLLDLVFSQIHSTIIAGSGYLKQTESKDLWF
jgi:uncharacterized membrane protein